MKALTALLVAAAVLALAWQAPAMAQEQESAAGGLLEYELNTIEVVERFGPSVVAVDVTIAGRTVSASENLPFDQFPDFFREFLPRFGGPREIPSRETAGSGFVIDDDGHITLNVDPS